MSHYSQFNRRRFGLLRYPGGKSKGLQQIVKLFPANFEEFREPFVGGGSVFFSIDSRKRRWINDLNPHLMAVYKALRDCPDTFIASCRAIAPASSNDPIFLSSKGTAYSKRLRDLFWRYVEDDNADSALRYFVLNRMGLNGRVLVNKASRRRMYFSNPEGWNIVNGDALETAAERLTGARISTGDYAALLTEEGNDCLVYCDPPYWRDTQLSKSGKLYEHGFTEADHLRFRDAVIASPHRVIVSYDDCPFIRDHWQGFGIHEAGWHYCGTTVGRHQGRELIITNYSASRTVVALPQPIRDEIGGNMSLGKHKVKAA